MSLVGFDPTFTVPPDFPTPQSPRADLNCAHQLTKLEHRHLCFMGNRLSTMRKSNPRQSAWKADA